MFAGGVASDRWPPSGLNNSGGWTLTSRHAPLRGTRREVNSLRPLRGRPGLRPAGLATVSGDILASTLAAIFGNAPASTLAVPGCSGLGQHISTIFGLALGSTLAASFSYGVASGHFVIAYFCFVVSYGVASGRHVIAYFCFVVAGGVASGRHVIAYFCFVVAGGVAAGRRPGRPRRGRNEQPHGAYPAGVRGVGYPCPFPYSEPRRGSTTSTQTIFSLLMFHANICIFLHILLSLQ